MPGPVVEFQYLNDIQSDGRVRRAGRALRDAGYDVVYVGTSRARGLRPLVDVEPIDGIPRKVLRPNSFDLEVPREGIAGRISQGAAALARRLPRLGGAAAVLSLRPRLIHAHDLHSFRFIVRFAKPLGIPVIYDSHELESGRNAPTWSDAEHARHVASEARYIPDAAGVVTVAPSIADKLVQMYGIDAPTVIVNAPPKTAIRKNTPLRTRLGLPESAQVILYLGGIASGRGIPDLLATLRRLPDHVHAAFLGPLNPDFAPTFAALADHFPQRVHQMPPVAVEAVVASAVGADIGYCAIEPVCESYRHALPNKFFECAFAGVPIIATPTHGMAPLIAKYRLGRIVQYEDPAALHRNLLEMLTDPDPQDAADRAAFIQEFCAETQSARLVGLVSRLTGAP